MKRLLCIALMISFAVVAVDASAFTLRELPDIDLASQDDPVPNPALFQATPGQQKSTGKAVLYSMILPGLGHNYLGIKKTAYSFFVVDAVLWASFIAFQVQSSNRESGYQDYALTFAGVTSTDHSDDFYRLLTQFNTSGNYESEVKSEGRAEFFPGGTAEELQQYYLDNRIGDFEQWVWTSESARRDFQDQRASSKESERRSYYTLALALTNRVVASLLAWRAARDMNIVADEVQTGFQLDIGTPAPSAGFGEFATGVSVIRKF